MLANMMGGKLRFAGIVFGCCLGTALPGCLGHRSGGSGGWLAENNYFFSLKSPSVKETDSAKLDADRSVTEAKPELLPWRSRLKGYRLGARLARGRDSAPDQHLPGTVATSANDAPATPSLENGELQFPAGVESLSVRSRPDIMVD